MSAKPTHCVISSCASTASFGSSARRTVCFALLCGLLCVSNVSNALAQTDKKTKPTIKADIVLNTRDGWAIHIDYFQSGGGRETPVVVLLHGEGGNRQVWRKGFAERLWKKDYAVITVDLRKHGQSVRLLGGAAAREKVTVSDRQSMVYLDMEAVKKFILTEHTAQRLNMNKLAIIAPEMSAAVAVNYALLDWSKRPHDDAGLGRGTQRGRDVRALILLSPEQNPKGLPTGQALRRLQSSAWQIAFYFFYGDKDQLDKKGEAKRMYNIVSAKKGSQSRMFLKKFTGLKYRGTDLLGKNNPRTKCEEHMLLFLDDHLKKLTRQRWVDRRSRFNRK